MDRGPTSGVIRDVRTLYTLGTLGGLTDAELLERFLAPGRRQGPDSPGCFRCCYWSIRSSWFERSSNPSGVIR